MPRGPDTATYSQRRCSEQEEETDEESAKSSSPEKRPLNGGKDNVLSQM